MSARRWLAEPLVYFVLLGASLFGVTALVDGSDDSVIVVDREQLLGFVRQQSRDFTPGHAEQRLDQADEQALKDLKAQYIREEALYREALALGFAQQDYVIRRRLVQRVELLAQGVATSNVVIDYQAAEAYYARHADDYVLPDRVSFTHVYFKPTEQAEGKAELALAALNTSAVGAAEASRYGERFLYHLNYVDRTLDFVSSHFGPEFTRALMALVADESRWQGPLRSEHGWHVVLFSRHVAAHLPTFQDVKERVLTDLRRERINAASEEIIAATLARYQIEDRSLR